jgi:hypothetical protein
MTTANATPAELLTAARAATGDRSPAWGTSWGRAAAFLARQALEQAVSTAWLGGLAELSTASFSDQLVCLPLLLGDEEAARARQAWYALSRACHAHPYELAPALSEVVELLEAAERAVSSLSNERRTTAP